jgi:hypothetical protein
LTGVVGSRSGAPALAAVPAARHAVLFCSDLGAPGLLDQPRVTHIERRGEHLYADLHVRREWIAEGRTVSVQVPGRPAFQLVLHPFEVEGTLLRFRGQAFDGAGDLYLRVRIAADGGGWLGRARAAFARPGPEGKPGHAVAAFWAIVLGLMLIVSYEGWTIGGLPAREVGYIFIGIGILEALRGTIFRGGLFRRRPGSPDDRGKEAGGRP